MASYMTDEKHDWVCGHAIEEINRLSDLKAKQTATINTRRLMRGMASVMNAELFKDNPEQKALMDIQDKYYKKVAYLLDIKITIWTQIIERAKNPNMLDIFNEAFDEFLQTGWEYMGQENIEEETKDAKDEYKMFKLLLSQIPDKKKKTRRGGKKHKKNKQAEDS